MSERKTISINPELFSLSGGNTTRKKRPSKENKDLKIKTATSKQPHSTKTLRNRLLHYIRKNQEENFKKLHGAKPEIVVPDKKYTTNIVTDNFNNDFEESLKYMTEIADQVTHKVDNEYMINQTLRNYKSLNPESVLAGGDFEKAVEGFSDISNLPVHNDFSPIDTMDSVKLSPAKQPQWGCMKGGSLPTYRVWSNQTQRLREPMKNHSDSMFKPSIIQSPSPLINLNNMSMSSIGSIGGQHSAPKVESTVTNSEFDSPRLSQLKQTMERIKTSNEATEKNKIKYGKRKKNNSENI